MSKSNDPVLAVFNDMAKTTPVKLVPIIDGYEADGVDGIEKAWEGIIKEVADES